VLTRNGVERVVDLLHARGRMEPDGDLEACADPRDGDSGSAAALVRCHLVNVVAGGYDPGEEVLHAGRAELVTEPRPTVFGDDRATAVHHGQAERVRVDAQPEPGGTCAVDARVPTASTSAEATTTHAVPRIRGKLPAAAGPHPECLDEMRLGLAAVALALAVGRDRSSIIAAHGVQHLAL